MINDPGSVRGNFAIDERARPVQAWTVWTTGAVAERSAALGLIT